jgi:hypothetical protein
MATTGVAEFSSPLRNRAAPTPPAKTAITEVIVLIDLNSLCVKPLLQESLVKTDDT